MIYLIEGRQKDTGARVRLRVEASSPIEALRRASRHGIIDLGTPIEEAAAPAEAPSADSGGADAARQPPTAAPAPSDPPARETPVKPPPRFPEELLPFLLPIFRREPGKRRVFALTEDGLIVGRLPRRASRNPINGTEALREFVHHTQRKGRLHAFRYSDIAEVHEAAVDSSRFLRLTIQSSGRSWRGVVPVVAGSLTMQALERCWGRAPQPARIRARPARLVLRGLLVLLSSLVGFGCLSALYRAVFGRAGSVVRADMWQGALWTGVVLVVLGAAIWLTWRARPAKPPRQRRRRRRRPHPVLWRVARACRLDIALRIAGAAAIVGAYLLAGRVSDELMARTRISGWESLFTRGAISLAWMLLTLPGVILIVLGYVLGQRSATEVLARDARPPILFLRSFGDDRKHTFTEESHLARFCALLTPKEVQRGGPILRHLRLWQSVASFIRFPLRTFALALGRGSDTAEEQLVRALRPFGPIIAVGDPSEALPTPGAARIYLDHPEWQDRVRQMIRSAALVIIQPSATEGVWWELETAIRELPPERMLICLRALADDDIKDIALARLGVTLTGRRLPDDLRNAAFLAFSRDWKPAPLPRADFNPLLWPWRGTSTDLLLTLRPALDRLPAPTAKAPVGEPAPPAPQAAGARDTPQAPTALASTGFGYRALAGFAYGLTPFALVAALICLPLLLRAFGPSLTGVRLLRETPAYRIELDTAWRDSGEETVNGWQSRTHRLGRDRTLVIAYAPRSRSGIQTLDRAWFSAIAAACVKEPGVVTSTIGPREVMVGGWPWQTATFEFANEDAETRARVQIWLLEAASHRFVVSCAEVQVAAPGIVAPASWDRAMFDSVRASVESLSPIDSVSFPVSEVRLALRALAGRTHPYTVRLAEGWAEGPAQSSPWDRSLISGQHTIRLGAGAGARIADPLESGRRLEQAIRNSLPLSSIEAPFVGWSKIENDLVFEARFDVIDSSGARRLLTWVSRATADGSVVEGSLESTDPDVARRAAALRDFRAMMGSMAPR